MSAGASGWYVIDGDGKVCGPYSAAQIRQFAAEGNIDRKTLISKDKTKWHPASDVKGLFPDIPAPPLAATVAPASQPQTVHHYQHYSGEAEAEKRYKEQELIAKMKQAKSLKSALWHLRLSVLVWVSVTLLLGFMAGYSGSLQDDKVWYAIVFISMPFFLWVLLATLLTVWHGYGAFGVFFAIILIAVGFLISSVLQPLGFVYNLLCLMVLLRGASSKLSDISSSPSAR